MIVTPEMARCGFMQIGFFVRVDREASERSDFCERQGYFVAGALYSFPPLQKPLQVEKQKDTRVTENAALVERA